MAPGEQMGGTTHGVGWGRRNYHPGQKKGDQTDYGEYNILMLEYLAGRRSPGAPVELTELLPVWQARLNGNWGAWKCTQTKQALQQVAAGAPPQTLGGMSNAMSMRAAAGLGAFATEDELAAAYGQQTTDLRGLLMAPDFSTFPRPVVSTPIFASKYSLVTQCCAKQDELVLQCLSPCSVCI